LGRVGPFGLLPCLKLWFSAVSAYNAHLEWCFPVTMTLYGPQLRKPEGQLNLFGVIL
jgi:hypothetical protein